MISQNKLDLWVKNRLNVLFYGAAGVGKTTVAKQCFERHGLNYLYFSCATLDPYVDFVGVPREKFDEKLQAYFLEMVQQRKLALDEIDAIFLDEFNRGPKKVRNAVLEILQFKSINGKRFNRLKFLWAAINPHDDAETYDVEPIDPAQLDRFHIQVEIPNKPDREWFKSEFGEQKGNIAVDWWGNQSEEAKKLVSPRRLEYVMRYYPIGVDLKDMLPACANDAELAHNLASAPVLETLKTFKAKKDEIGAETFLEDENNFNASESYILANNEYIGFFVKLLSEEKISSLMATNMQVCNWVIAHSNKGQKVDKFMNVCKEIYDSNTNQKLISRFTKDLQEALKVWNPKKPVSNDAWINELAGHSKTLDNSTTAQRSKLYKLLREKTPEKPTFEQANETLRLLEQVVVKTQADKLTELKDEIVPVVSRCLTADGIENLETLERTHGQLYNKLVFTQLDKEIK